MTLAFWQAGNLDAAARAVRDWARVDGTPSRRPPLRGAHLRRHRRGRPRRGGRRAGRAARALRRRRMGAAGAAAPAPERSRGRHSRRSSARWRWAAGRRAARPARAGARDRAERGLSPLPAYRMLTARETIRPSVTQRDDRLHAHDALGHRRQRHRVGGREGGGVGQRDVQVVDELAAASRAARCDRRSSAGTESPGGRRCPRRACPVRRGPAPSTTGAKIRKLVSQMSTPGDQAARPFGDVCGGAGSA